MNTIYYASLILLLLNWYQSGYTRSNYDSELLMTDQNISQLDNQIQSIDSKINKTKHSFINTIYAIKTDNYINDFNSIDSINIHDAKELDELYCLALNIYFEARGESEIGQKAVGHVVINRVGDEKFPNSVCKVVKQGGERKLNRCQFSWWCDGRSDRPTNLTSWRQCIRIAREIYFGKTTDPTHGALWYHAEYVSPYWKKALLRGPKIGKHVFYKDHRVSPLDHDNNKSAST